MFSIIPCLCRQVSDIARIYIFYCVYSLFIWEPTSHILIFYNNILFIPQKLHTFLLKCSVPIAKVVSITAEFISDGSGFRSNPGACFIFLKIGCHSTLNFFFNAFGSIESFNWKKGWMHYPLNDIPQTHISHALFLLVFVGSKNCCGPCQKSPW